MNTDWNAMLADQLDWHWQNQLQPRMDGLTDEEYFWEPVTGCWNLRPRNESASATEPGSGDYTVDFAFPQPGQPTSTQPSVRSTAFFQPA
jgi:hypothetical protein